MVLMMQIGLIAESCGRVGVVDLRAVYFLERLHRADGRDQLQAGVIAEQIAGKIEGQRRDAMFWHKIAHLQPHFAEIALGQRDAFLGIFNAEDRVFVASATVNIFAGYAQANHRRLAEAGLIGAGLHEILKDIAVQLAKVFGHAEAVLVFIMLQQQHAKIIIPHIRREVIADDTGMALTGFFIDNMRLQDLYHRKTGGILSNIHLDRNNIQFHRIAIVVGIIPVRQGIKPVIHHD